MWHTCSSSRAGEHQRRVWGLHAFMECGHRDDLPLVDAKLCDIFVRFNIFCSSLLHGSSRVKVKHLGETTASAYRRSMEIFHKKPCYKEKCCTRIKLWIGIKPLSFEMEEKQLYIMQKYFWPNSIWDNENYTHFMIAKLIKHREGILSDNISDSDTSWRHNSTDTNGAQWRTWKATAS